MRGFAAAAFCHELRGDEVEGELLLEMVRRWLKTGPRPGLVGTAATAARALAHRGLHGEARELFPVVLRGEGSGPLLEALSEVAAAAEDWEWARELLPLAREEAESGGLLALPLFADRLEARLAALDGDRGARRSCCGVR
jgi:hypothetical protein